MAGRVTSVYLNDEEYDRLRELAAEREQAPNAVLRIALRRLLGLPVPAWAHNLHDQLTKT